MWDSRLFMLGLRKVERYVKNGKVDFINTSW